jgi:hypothetical protein
LSFYVVGRLVVTTILGVICVVPCAVGAEYELYEDDALGVALHVPPGFEADVREPAEGGKTRALELKWRDGPYAGLNALMVAREAEYADAVVLAGMFQRRLGVPAGFDVEAQPLSKVELASAGAEDGLRASYEVSNGNGRRRLEVLFLSRDRRRYRLEISFAVVDDARLEAVAEQMINSFEILAASEELPREARDARGAAEAGQPAASE